MEPAMTTQPLPDTVVEIAGGTAVVHVATSLPDGAPHNVPVWVAVEDGRLAFLTSPGSRKARNLARDPRLAISMVDPANPMRMATVRGRVAHVVDGDAGWAIIDRISQRYLGTPYPLREDRVVYLVDAETVTTQAF
jgi:PPOX class probable F420-dependent enzyme